MNSEPLDRQSGAWYRRWLHYSLRTFFLGTTIAMLVAAWIAVHARWITDREAALDQLPPFHFISELVHSNDQQSKRLPPFSLGWLGETHGLAKIRLQPDFDDPEAVVPQLRRLQRSFPEASVWISPDDPAAPDPIDDNASASRLWAFDLKMKAMTQSQGGTAAKTGGWSNRIAA